MFTIDNSQLVTVIWTGVGVEVAIALVGFGTIGVMLLFQSLEVKALRAAVEKLLRK
jgi:hypothetical protein